MLRKLQTGRKAADNKRVTEGCYFIDEILQNKNMCQICKFLCYLSDMSLL